MLLNIFVLFLALIDAKIVPSLASGISNWLLNSFDMTSCLP